MKKITYLLLLLAFVGQLALAQRTRPIVVQFTNGNVLRGEVFRLPDNRLRIYAGNGIVVNFVIGDVRSMTYADDNSRVTSIPPLPQQRQQNSQAQQQQRPPNNQQNRQGTQQQPNQRQGQQQQNPQNSQNRQGQQQPNQRQGQQQNRQGSQQSQNNRQNNQQQQQPRTSQNNQSNDDFFFEDEGIDILLSPNAPSNKKQETKKQDSKTQSSSTSSTNNRQASTSTGANLADQPFSIRPRLIVEGGYTMGMGNEFAKVSRMEGSLSFGAQVTRDLFVGIGAGINMFGDKVYFYYDSAKVSSAVDTLDNMNMSLPLYLDVRYNIPVGNGQIVPFVGIKGGTSFGFITRKFMKEENTIRTETKPESLGLYISPFVGAKYMLTNSLAVNMSLGYTMQMRKYVYNAKTTTPMNRSESMGGVTIRIGLEF